MILFVLALIIMVTITLRQTTAPYYFKYYVERPDLIAAFVPAYMFSAAAGAALADPDPPDRQTQFDDHTHDPNRHFFRRVLFRAQGSCGGYVRPADCDWFSAWP